MWLGYVQVNLTTSGCRDFERASVFTLNLPQVPAESTSNKFQIAFCVDAGNNRDVAVIVKATLAPASKDNLVGTQNLNMNSNH